MLQGQGLRLKRPNVQIVSIATPPDAVTPSAGQVFLLMRVKRRNQLKKYNHPLTADAYGIYIL